MLSHRRSLFFSEVDIPLIAFSSGFFQVFNHSGFFIFLQLNLLISRPSCNYSKPCCMWLPVCCPSCPPSPAQLPLWFAPRQFYPARCPVSRGRDGVGGLREEVGCRKQGLLHGGCKVGTQGKETCLLGSPAVVWRLQTVTRLPGTPPPLLLPVVSQPWPGALRLAAHSCCPVSLLSGEGSCQGPGPGRPALVS